MTAKDEREMFSPEQEIDFMYLIVVREKTQKEVHQHYNIGLSALKTRIANIKETLKTVTYIEDTISYSELRTLDRKLVRRLIKDSLLPPVKKNKTTKTTITSTPTTALLASISESTPFGTLPPISIAFRNSLDNSGVAATEQLSDSLTHQRQHKTARLMKPDNTMNSPTTNVGALRHQLGTKKAKDSIKLPQIETNAKSKPKKLVLRGIPDATSFVTNNQKAKISKPFHFLEHEQSSSEDEDG